jgi:hypothetical protein
MDCCISFSSFSIISYSVSFFAPYHCKISSEESSTAMIIRSTSSSVNVAFILGLLARILFLAEGFFRETFRFFDVLASIRGSFDDVTFPFCWNTFKIISLKLYPILFTLSQSRFPNDKSILFLILKVHTRSTVD